MDQESSGETQAQASRTEAEWLSLNSCCPRNLAARTLLSSTYGNAVLISAQSFSWICTVPADNPVTVAAAKDALLASGEFPLGLEAVNFTRPFVEGIIARMTNDEHN